jgi:5'-nucleotidase
LRRQRFVAAIAVVAAAVVGVPTAASAAPPAPAPTGDIAVQLMAMNDVHGRTDPVADTSSDAKLYDPVDPGGDGVFGPNPAKENKNDDPYVVVGGAQNIASTVTSTRAAFIAQGGTDAASLFVGAGDLVSASPFNSSAFKDEPTIEVLNAMGLDVSAVGNHEFDRGTQELRRISAATDGTYTDDVTACQGIQVGVTGCFGTDEHRFTGADFPYLAANVLSRKTGKPMLPPYQVFDVGGGKKLALIGVVTETTPTIAAAAGIQDVMFIDEAEAVNRYVPELQRKGIQAIGVLVHEGGSNTGTDKRDWNGCDTLSGPVVDINNAVSPAVDLIISAHSHQAYNCRLTDSAGQPRLVTQAGFYGRLLSDIRLTLDRTTGDVVRWCAPYQAANQPVLRDNPDPQVTSIVNFWAQRGAATGNVVVGHTAAAITATARDVETPLGDLIAQSQLEAAQRDAGLGSPVLAFMNPGGVRTSLDAGPVTYAELFAVQPFSNTVNTITLTGADIRGVLEQQFQKDQARGSQLILGTSDNFTYRYNLSRPYGDRVDPPSITLNNVPVVATQTYRVVANSFLIAGGDSFGSFANGTNPATGPVDVDASVEYFKNHPNVAPPAANHAVVTTDGWTSSPANLPSTTATPVTTVDAEPGLAGPVCDATATISIAKPTRGESVTVTGAAFAPNKQVTATLANGRLLGSAKADGTGAVSIAFRVPADLPAGQQAVTLTSTSGEKASTTFTLGTVRSDVKTVITSFITTLLAWPRGR